MKHTISYYQAQSDTVYLNILGTFRISNVSDLEPDFVDIITSNLFTNGGNFIDSCVTNIFSRMFLFQEFSAIVKSIYANAAS